MYVLAMFMFAGNEASSASYTHRLLARWMPHLSSAEIRQCVLVARKAGHVLAYGFLTLIVYLAARRTRKLRRGALPFAMAFAFIVAMADEGYQSLLKYRTGTWDDVLIDGIGIALVALGLWLSTWVKRRQHKEVAKKMLKTNVGSLVRLSVQGQITPPLQRGAYRVDREGVPFVLPGTGGICYNVKVGHLAFGWTGDHVEPCVSSAATIDDRSSGKNVAYNTLACVGNEAVVISGDAKGAKGVVTGMHGGIEHVLIDFADEDLEKMAIEDKILIKSFGQGLELVDYPGIFVRNLDPALLDKLGIKEENGQLVVPVAGKVPARFMGSGIGSASTASGDYDITTTDREELKALGLDQLKFGDLVALEDSDNRFGRSYRRGALTVGIIVHSDCLVAGHGPGVTTLFTAIDGSLKVDLDPDANLGRMLKIGTFR